MGEGTKADKTVAELAQEAKGLGALQVKTPDGPIWIVAPRARAKDAPAPFSGDVTRLLQPPLARAAYSDRTAWLMATLSELAYQPLERDEAVLTKVQRCLADAGMHLVAYFDDSTVGTQAFLARRPGEFAALVFRGTEKDMSDILADLNARFVETPSGRAHCGFVSAFACLREEIFEEVEQLDPEEPLYVAGHSLGGALATIATKEIESCQLVAACYTFGSPRVGTVEWSDGVKTPVYRVVNGADGVPTFPGTIFIKWLLEKIPHIPGLGWLEPTIRRTVKSGWVGYQHVGDQRFLHGPLERVTLKYGEGARWPRWRACVISPVKGMFRALSKGRFCIRQFSGYFKDHAIHAYAMKLQKIALERNPAT